MAEFVIRLNQSTDIRRNTLLSGISYAIASYIMAFYLLPNFLEFSMLASSLLFCASIFTLVLAVFKLGSFALLSALDIFKKGVDGLALNLRSIARREYMRNRIAEISHYLISRSIRV